MDRWVATVTAESLTYEERVAPVSETRKGSTRGHLKPRVRGRSLVVKYTG